MVQADLPLAGGAEKRTDFATDAILLARARGSRNIPHSRPHALRLTLLGDFADESCPRIILSLDEIRPRLIRFLSAVLAGILHPGSEPGVLKCVDGFNAIKRLSTLAVHAARITQRSHDQDGRK